MVLPGHGHVLMFLCDHRSFYLTALTNPCVHDYHHLSYRRPHASWRPRPRCKRCVCLGGNDICASMDRHYVICHFVLGEQRKQCGIYLRSRCR